MFPTFSLAVAIFFGAVALLAVAGLFVDRCEPLARTAMKIGQLAAAVVVLLDVITLAQGHEPVDRTTHIGYGVAVLGLPVLLLTRRPEAEGEEAPLPHLGVVAVTAVAMVVLVIRFQQTW